MATSGENYWPPTGRTSWPLTVSLQRSMSDLVPHQFEESELVIAH